MFVVLMDGHPLMIGCSFNVQFFNQTDALVAAAKLASDFAGSYTVLVRKMF